jgi:aminoglycoside phosphotransferase (APT) family kinase protein
MATTKDGPLTGPWGGADTDYRAELSGWVAAQAGGAIVGWRRVAAGGRRIGIAVEVRPPTGPDLELYVAVETTRRAAEDQTSRLALEAEIFTRLRVADVPVPDVIAIHPSQDAMLMTRQPGSAGYAAISDPDRSAAVARDFMACLARIHHVDPAEGAFASLGPVLSAREHLGRFLESWASSYRRGSPEPDPVLEFGLRWLRSARPSVDRPARLVQGDTGPGNFLFEGESVTAVLDWELAHFGDPQEDLGWLSMRAAQEPMPDFPALLAFYAERAGTSLDLPAIRYYRVLAEWTVAVIGHLKPRSGLGDTERGNALVYEQLHRRLLVEAIADAVGAIGTLPGVTLPEAPPSPRTWLYDMALDQIRESVVPRLTDPLGERRAKGVARTVRVLRELDRYHRELDALLADARIKALGHVGEPGDLAAAIADSRVDDQAALRYAWADASVTTAVCRPAMGRLASTHLAPLTPGEPA